MGFTSNARSERSDPLIQAVLQYCSWGFCIKSVCLTRFRSLAVEISTAWRDQWKRGGLEAGAIDCRHCTDLNMPHATHISTPSLTEMFSIFHVLVVFRDWLWLGETDVSELRPLRAFVHPRVAAMWTMVRWCQLGLTPNSSTRANCWGNCDLKVAQRLELNTILSSHQPRQVDNNRRFWNHLRPPPSVPDGDREGFRNVCFLWPLDTADGPRGFYWARKELFSYLKPNELLNFSNCHAGFTVFKFLIQPKINL
jgi:hypothetical protein